MNPKLGMFFVLVFGVMMLFIPASSMANAQDYDLYYNNDEYYYEKDYYPPKENKMKKEPPMLVVDKEVLFCDVIANGTSGDCGVLNFPGPNSDRYIEECTATTGIFGEVCDTVNEEFFDIVITDDIKFSGSDEGTKLNFNGEVFRVTEKGLVEFAPLCQKAGFDNSLFKMIDGVPIGICVLFEGECSGFIQDGELKECTVKNYVVAIEEEETTTAKLTVNKEIYVCGEVVDGELNCSDLDSMSDDWTLCSDIVFDPNLDEFCNSIQEQDFDIKVSDNNNILIDPPGQFVGTINGTMITDLEPGTYNIEEIVHDNSNNQLGEEQFISQLCSGNGFVDGGFFDDDSGITYEICFEYENENGDPCGSTELEAGDENLCTVKNYIRFATPTS
ncbi:MAG: hypothetical protein ACPKPY_06050 [Nitrososphaeraceae archaeon]